ncbi:class F sortase [Kitasatospora setae]|uniref:Putative peptidase C60 family protein n=1 Tax=Kitasatospora setae (strain ATCC 33774 / DSM 43861 / JCM 3304 / KCC A-0304 / NBRC 14216 / KM-6054) TaxID=452652 RepID=E4N0S4_KITSK|nr:putative peptidase C60 family protein [Kitasatospora setae KM-6054]
MRVGTAAVALLSGVWLVDDGLTTSQPPPPPAQAPPSPGGAAGSARPAPGVAALGPSDPVRLRIPSIAVDAAFTPLGLDPAGALATPPLGRRDLVGWYRDAPAPGADGTAVVVGHVDDRRGPGVLYRLGLLRPGLTLTVTRQDRRTAVFTVDAVRSYPKAAFPAAEVYAPAGRAELRVITCGGRYDRRTGYDSNTVVYAHLTAVS